MTEPAPTPLSPYALLHGLHIHLPMGPVTVAGNVHSVRLHEASNAAYVELVGGGGRIEARVPLNEAPTKHEAIRVTGTVSVNPSRFNVGLDVLVAGNVDGILAHRPTRQRVEFEKTRYVLLDALLVDLRVPVEDLTVIGTQRAYSDLAGRLQAKPAFEVVSTIDPAAIIATARRVVSGGAKGLIFARGGSGDATEDLWDEPSFVAQLVQIGIPFYTAIGHSDRSYLADRYADQAFLTPTDVGAMLARIERQRAESAEREAAYERRGVDLQEQKQMIAALRAENARLLRRPAQPVVDASPAPRVTVHWAPTLTPQAWALVIAFLVFVVAVSPWFRR